MHSKFFDYFKKLQENFQSIEEKINLLTEKHPQEKLFSDTLAALKAHGCHKWGQDQEHQSEIGVSIQELPEKKRHTHLCTYKDNFMQVFSPLIKSYDDNYHYYFTKYIFTSIENFAYDEMNYGEVDCFQQIKANILALELLLVIPKHHQVFRLEALKAHFEPFLPNVDYEISGEKGLVFTYCAEEDYLSNLEWTCHKFKLGLEALGVELTDVSLQKGQKLVVAVDDVTPILELAQFELKNFPSRFFAYCYIEEKTKEASFRLRELLTTERNLSEQARKLVNVLGPKIAVLSKTCEEYKLLSEALAQYQIIAETADIWFDKESTEVILKENLTLDKLADYGRKLYVNVSQGTQSKEGAAAKRFTALRWISVHFTQLHTSLSKVTNFSRSEFDIVNQYLITPVQRIPRYVLLMNDLMSSLNKLQLVHDFSAVRCLEPAVAGLVHLREGFINLGVSTNAWIGKREEASGKGKPQEPYTLLKAVYNLFVAHNDSSQSVSLSTSVLSHSVIGQFPAPEIAAEGELSQLFERKDKPLDVNPEFDECLQTSYLTYETQSQVFFATPKEEPVLDLDLEELPVHQSSVSVVDFDQQSDSSSSQVTLPTSSWMFSLKIKHDGHCEYYGDFPHDDDTYLNGFNDIQGVIQQIAIAAPYYIAFVDAQGMTRKGILDAVATEEEKIREEYWGMGIAIVLGYTPEAKQAFQNNYTNVLFHSLIPLEIAAEAEQSQLFEPLDVNPEFDVQLQTSRVFSPPPKEESLGLEKLPVHQSSVSVVDFEQQSDSSSSQVTPPTFRWMFSLKIKHEQRNYCKYYGDFPHDDDLTNLNGFGDIQSAIQEIAIAAPYYIAFVDAQGMTRKRILDAVATEEEKIREEYWGMGIAIVLGYTPEAKQAFLEKYAKKMQEQGYDPEERLGVCFETLREARVEDQVGEFVKVEGGEEEEFMAVEEGAHPLSGVSGGKGNGDTSLSKRQDKDEPMNPSPREAGATKGVLAEAANQPKGPLRFDKVSWLFNASNWVLLGISFFVASALAVTVSLQPVLASILLGGALMSGMGGLCMPLISRIFQKYHLLSKQRGIIEELTEIEELLNRDQLGQYSVLGTALLLCAVAVVLSGFYFAGYDVGFFGTLLNGLSDALASALKLISDLPGLGFLDMAGGSLALKITAALVVAATPLYTFGALQRVMRVDGDDHDKEDGRGSPNLIIESDSEDSEMDSTEEFRRSPLDLKSNERERPTAQVQGSSLSKT